MKTMQNPTITRRTTRSLSTFAGLTLALVLAPTACEGNSTEPIAPLQSITTTSEITYFTSTPPNPPYVGDTYQVVAESGFGTPQLWSETPSVCAFPEEQVSSPGTVTFLAAGTCRLAAQCVLCAYYDPETVHQEFQIVTPWAPGTPGAPVNPGTPPGRGGPAGIPRGRPN